MVPAEKRLKYGGGPAVHEGPCILKKMCDPPPSCLACVVVRTNTDAEKTLCQGAISFHPVGVRICVVLLLCQAQEYKKVLAHFDFMRVPPPSCLACVVVRTNTETEKNTAPGCDLFPPCWCSHLCCAFLLPGPRVQEGPCIL